MTTQGVVGTRDTNGEPLQGEIAGSGCWGAARGKQKQPGLIVQAAFKHAKNLLRIALPLPHAR